MKKNKQLIFYQQAPDLTLKNTAGDEVKLSSLWIKRPLILSFTRHFGCTQCKEMLEQLVDGRQKIEKAGLSVAVITQGTVESLSLFAPKYAPGLLCLADPERQAYAAYGLDRGGLFQTFLNLKVWLAISKSQKKGYKVEPPPVGQDAMLMSGVFIINQEGKVVLPYYFDNIADHPTLDLLLNGVLSTSWTQSFDGPVVPTTK